MEEKSNKSRMDLINPGLGLNLRHRQGPQKVIQVLCAVFFACVVLIGVFALTSRSRRPGSSSLHERRKAIHTFQSPLLNKLRSSVEERPKVSLNDIFITVKTSYKFHQSRLAVILKTWYQLARDQIWFFTDAPDDTLDVVTANHLVVTECPADHSRQALCCKMQAEFDAFLASNKKWFCHFDDDQYVNVPALVRKLNQFDYRREWYLGKPSIQHPLEILDRDSPDIQKRISFWFATGGAGFCLSRSLANAMSGVAGGGKFESVGDRMRLPDDVTMGYVIDHLVKVKMTVVDEFHSHLEPLRLVKDYEDQISFSYGNYGTEMNTLEVEGFGVEEDKTRFLSLHCKLFPNFSWCPRRYR